MLYTLPEFSFRFFLSALFYYVQGLIIYFVYIRWLRVDSTNDDIMVRMFAAGAVPGALVVLLIELVCTIIFASICFGGQISSFLEQVEIANENAENKPDFQLERGFGYYSFYFLTAFITAGTVEEITKASLVRHTCCGCDGDRACCIQRPDPNPRTQAFTTISLLLAASIGFSTTENLMYVFTGSDSAAGDTIGYILLSKLLLALLRGAVSMPIHAICSAFTGLRLTIRDVQRREHDMVMVSHLSANGVPQFVVLASGVTVPVQSALTNDSHHQYVSPPTATTVPDWGQPVQSARMVNVQPNQYPTATPVNITNGARGIPPTTANPTRTIKVWNWLRVLWPAILIHGTFDFLLMIFGDGVTIPNVGGMIVVILLCTIIVSGASLWALVSQFKAAFDKVSRGEIPEHVTCAPVWWPQCLRRCLASMGIMNATAVYDSLDNGLSPPLSSNNPNNYGGGSPNGNDDNNQQQQMLPPPVTYSNAVTGAPMQRSTNAFHASELINYAEQIHHSRAQQQQQQQQPNLYPSTISNTSNNPYQSQPSTAAVRVIDSRTAQQLLMSSSADGIPTAIPVATRIG